MSRRTDEYARRREALERQCAAQREQLAAASAVIESHLQVVDHKVAELRRLRLPSLWATGGAIVATVLGFRRLTRTMEWVGRINTILSLVRRFI